VIRSRFIAGFHGVDTATPSHREDAPGVTTRREESALDAKPHKERVGDEGGGTGTATCRMTAWTSPRISPKLTDRQ